MIQEFRQAIFNRFKSELEWPRYRELEVDFIDHAPIQLLLDQLPPGEVIQQYPVTRDSQVLLTLEGIAKCEGGEDLVDGYMSAARFAGELYQRQRARASFTNHDLVQELGLTMREALLVSHLIWELGGPVTDGGSRSHDDRDFEFTVSPRAIYLRKVETLDDYAEAVDMIEEIRRKEAVVGDPESRMRSPERGSSVHAAFVSPEASLHSVVAIAAERLLPVNAHAEAVRLSFQMFETFIQMVSGEADRSGADLMSHTFRPENPIIPLGPLESRHELSEQRGFMLLAMGSMMGIRNPHSHGPPAELSRDVAIEQLALASYLFRRVEEATGKSAVDLGVAGDLKSARSST